MYHPVTVEYNLIGEKIRKVVDAIIDSIRNYIVIYPNNDLGSEVILHEFERFTDNKRFRIFPLLRFEFFLILLKNADFMVGNSSAGVREAGIYGIPVIDIGTRQTGRYNELVTRNIIHTDEDKDEILTAIDNIEKQAYETHLFGDGNSTERFCKIVEDQDFWNIELQKHFIDFQM